MKKRCLIDVEIETHKDDLKRCSLDCKYLHEDHEFLTFYCGLFLQSKSELVEGYTINDAYHNKIIKRCEECINLFK